MDPFEGGYLMEQYTVKEQKEMPYYNMDRTWACRNFPFLPLLTEFCFPAYF